MLKVKDKERQAEAILTHRNNSATKIQALVRGVQSRNRFNRNLPALKKALTARGFCVECENKVARRRCRECRDNFCEACFEKMHKKGMYLKYTMLVGCFMMQYDEYYVHF